MHLLIVVNLGEKMRKIFVRFAECLYLYKIILLKTEPIEKKLIKKSTLN